MRDACRLICLALIGLFRSRASLQAEILTLRHQLNVLRRKSPQRLTFTSIDRLVFAGLYRLAPGVLDALKIVRPETVIRWHRAGFRAYWRRGVLLQVGVLTKDTHRNTIRFTPPWIIDESQVDWAAGCLVEVLQKVVKANTSV